MPQLTPVSSDPFAQDGAQDDGGYAAAMALVQRALAAGNTIRGAFTPSQTPGDPSASGPNRLMSIGASPIDQYMGAVGQQLGQAASLPHDVATGQVDPLSDQGIGRGNALATLMVGGGLGGHEAPEMANSLASKSPRLYDVPSAKLRDFAADYPDGAPLGQLTRDIEGRDLSAPFIAGRRSGGELDQAITPAQFDAISEGAIGSIPAAVAGPKVPGGGVGAYVAGRGIDGPTRDIFFDKSLPAAKQPLVVGHEIGHAIDDIAGQIPQGGLKDQLEAVYHALNNPDASARAKQWTPQAGGYSAKDAPHEYMAEAIRAYMADPNYLKSAAPDVAKAIRAAVNDHPVLSKTIQFNVGSPYMAGMGVLNDPNKLSQFLANGGA